MYNNTILINRKFRPQGLLLVYILCVRFFFHFLNVFDSFCWALNTHNKLTKSNKIKLVFWIFTNWKSIVLSSRKQIAQCITASWIFVIFVPCEYDMENSTSLLCHWDLRLKRIFSSKKCAYVASSQKHNESWPAKFV